jgi:FkbM family methyltransferase
VGAIGEFRQEVRRAWHHSENERHRARTFVRLSKLHAFAKLGKSMVIPLGTHSRLVVDPRFPSTQKAASGNSRELFAWRRLLNNGDLFVDVGANAGVYSLWAADLGSRVISVEPGDEARHALEHNASLNDYSFTVVSAALFDHIGTMRITKNRGPESRLLLSDADEGMEVEVTTLDEILGDRVANGVKLDVEGAERYVLEGAKKSLSEGRIRALQIEYNICAEKYYGETRIPLRDMLSGYGYRFWQPNGEGVLEPFDPGEGGRRHRDVFATLTG